MERRIRRRGPALAVGALSLALVSACGAAPESGEGKSGGAGFPVTVETLHGEVEIPSKPEKVVALGWSDAEAALALGVQPVGVSDWLGYGGKGVGPWAEDLFDTAPEDLGTMEVSEEAVAGLDPDVILNTRSDNQESKFAKLSEIVPVVDPPKGVEVSYGTTWRQQMTQVSTALGEREKGEELISDLEERFATVAEEHPEFKGKSVAVAAFYGDKLGVYVSGDSRVDLMEELGFENKPEINDLAKDQFYVDLDLEKIEMLDADLTVVFPIGLESEEVTDNKVLNSIPSAQDGRLVVLDDPDLANAFSSGSTLGTAYALERAPEQFVEALAD